MGLPPKEPQFRLVRIKSKSREFDLTKIGITGRVRLDIIGSRGNRVIEITNVDEKPLDSPERVGL